MNWNSEIDVELGTHPLVEEELREVKEAVFVSFSQSQPESVEYAFCLSAGERMHFFLRKAGYLPFNPLVRRPTASFRALSAMSFNSS
jgi:hypothetical protein